MSEESSLRKPASQASLKLEKQKLFVIDDQGGLLSNLGGLPVLTMLLENSQIIERVAELVPEWRKCPELAEYSKEELLLQRLLLITSGNPDAIDCTIFGHDPALASCLKKDPEGGRVASQSTHTRQENKISEQTATKLEEDFYLPFFFEQYKHAPQKLTINIDGLAIQTFGTQQGSTYRGGKKKGQQQFFPLLAATDDGWIVLNKLRYGRVSDANSNEDIERLVLRLKTQWPRTRLRLRMDTGFNNPELLQFLDEESIDYECGFPFTHAVEKACNHQLSENVFEQVESEFRKKFGEPKFTGKDGKKAFQQEHNRIRDLPAEERTKEEHELKKRHIRRIVDIMHEGPWDEERRLIVRVDFDDGGLDVRCIVTSQKFGIPALIYENGYCMRTHVEACIKENKSHSKVPLSCQEYNSNRFRFFMQGLAYLVLNMLRRALKAKKKLSINSVRSLLLTIPVAIEVTPRRLRWHLSSVHPGTATLINLIHQLT
jgi:hypothetical protein